jgi:AcrR family transcriptional regulator
MFGAAMAGRAIRTESGAAKRKAAPARRPASETSVSGKRERNKAHNRGAILDAAREVFTDLGYDGATVRDVIRRTRLGSGTFYNYFPDKESVFRELLRESEARRLEWLGKVERGGGYQRFLRDSFRAYFEFVVTDRTTFDLLRRNSATVRAFARDPVIIDERARLSRVLSHEMEGGDLPAADAEFVASAMIGVCFEVAVMMVERSPIDVDQATEFVANLFVGFFERVARSPSAKERRVMDRVAE